MPVPTLNDIPVEDAIQYAGRDADATGRLEPILTAQIRELELERALELDLSVIPMIARMTEIGMAVNRERLGMLHSVFLDNLADIEYRANKLAGTRFNPGSGDQVAWLLYDVLNLPGRRLTKSKKRLTADEKALQALRTAHPVVPLILEWREIDKLRSSYTEKLPGLISPDGRWRYELGITTVPSGRLNGWGGVNPLAIPVRTELGRAIRGCFEAPPGRMLGAADLNQIELRALAILSGDENLLEAFSTGKDLHRLTAAEALYHVPFDSITFEQRQRGKTLNFAVANQISGLGLMEQFIVSGVDTDELECQRMLDAWYERYSKVRPYFEAVYAEGRQNGYIRSRLSGRILWTPGLRSTIDKVRAEAERVATNWTIQEWAQAVMKMGMALVWRLIEGTDIDPLLQVHDELILEFPEDSYDNQVTIGEDAVALMESVGEGMPIPILAAWHEGKTWEELK